jgi:hypothetical protein
MGGGRVCVPGLPVPSPSRSTGLPWLLPMVGYVMAGAPTLSLEGRLFSICSVGGVGDGSMDHGWSVGKTVCRGGRSACGNFWIRDRRERTEERRMENSAADQTRQGKAKAGQASRSGVEWRSGIGSGVAVAVTWTCFRCSQG